MNKQLKETETEREKARETNKQTDKQFSIELCVFHALCENCLNSLAEKLTNSPPYAVINALVISVVVVIYDSYITIYKYAHIV